MTVLNPGLCFHNRGTAVTSPNFLNVNSHRMITDEHSVHLISINGALKKRMDDILAIFIDSMCLLYGAGDMKKSLT